MEIHIIELPKAIKEYENNKQDEILQWMMFLDKPEDMEVVKIMQENEDIKEAKEELDKISQDDILRRMALKADLARRDYNQAMYDAEERGKRAGIEVGTKAGIETGAKKAKLEDARKMLEKGIELNLIIEITGLSREEIEVLKS